MENAHQKSGIILMKIEYTIDALIQILQHVCLINETSQKVDFLKDLNE